MANFTLRDLEKRVEARAKEPSAPGAETSYTRKLLDRGVAHCAKKLGEEAIETVIAAVEDDRERLIAETADLIYHLLVVLAARGITLADVEAVLAERTRAIGPAGKGVAPARLRKTVDGAAHRGRPVALPHLHAGGMGGQAPRHADDVDGG